VLDTLVAVKKHIMFTGSTGVGKSVIVQKYLAQNQERQELSVINLNFSAQTTSLMTQETIESKLVPKAGKDKIGPKGKNTAVIFVDDINMPLVEEYGAQPPIELLRQLVDMGGLYNRAPHYWKDIDRFILMAAAAPPTGGRYALTPRIMRHFHIFNLPDPTDEAMRKIFEAILEGFLQANVFVDKVRKCGNIAVAATIDMYQ
jgi:dynein heavy chain